MVYQVFLGLHHHNEHFNPVFKARASAPLSRDPSFFRFQSVEMLCNHFSNLVHLSEYVLMSEYVNQIIETLVINTFHTKHLFHPIDARALKSERLAFQSC